MERLEGKRAIVTGAGAGIGRAIALRLAGEGARVVLADLDGQAAEGVAGEIEGKTLVRQTDVTHSTEVEALVRGVGAAAALGVGEDRVAVFVEGDAEAARAALADRLSLRGRSVLVQPMERLPVTPSGKIDYGALAREIGRAA